MTYCVNFKTVASTLIRRGRLTLAQLIKYSSLKPRTARACILVLVQHNLAWHAHTDDGLGEALEFNVEECLLRMRFGRFVWQAAELFGDAVCYTNPCNVVSELKHTCMSGGRDHPTDSRSRENAAT
jgi:hypothetical protein